MAVPFTPNGVVPSLIVFLLKPNNFHKVNVIQRSHEIIPMSSKMSGVPPSGHKVTARPQVTRSLFFMRKLKQHRSQVVFLNCRGRAVALKMAPGRRSRKPPLGPHTGADPGLEGFVQEFRLENRSYPDVHDFSLRMQVIIAND